MPDKIMLDTNVLLNYHSKALEQYKKVYIPITVLEELDKLKMSDSEEKKFKARQAIRALEEADNVEYILDENLDMVKADNKILKAAQDNGCKLITQDINMRVKADALGLDVEKFEVEVCEDNYTGIRETWISEKEYVDLLEGLDKNPYNLYPNEYLIINNTTNKDQYLLMWNGKYFEEVKVRPITNKYITKINPLDIYQRAFIHMLQNENVKIKITDSGYGCGKSFLMLHWSLQMLDKDKFDKLLFIKSDSPPKNRKEYPALPGNINEKSEGLMGVLCDTTSENNLIDILDRNRKLEILPIQFAKGRSLKNSIVFINEAQDFTPSEMEKLLSRLGEGSVCLLDGSTAQIDNRYCKFRNGLTVASNNFKDEQIAAQVNMINDYRSEISRIVGQKNWND